MERRFSEGIVRRLRSGSFRTALAAGVALVGAFGSVRPVAASEVDCSSYVEVEGNIVRISPGKKVIFDYSTGVGFRAGLTEPGNFLGGVTAQGREGSVPEVTFDAACDVTLAFRPLRDSITTTLPNSPGNDEPLSNTPNNSN